MSENGTQVDVVGVMTSASPSIQTLCGYYFALTAPNPGAITVVDIAHALSHICRYTGHCSKFYSVAEHCVRASFLADRFSNDPKMVLTALMHDAAEAYTGDISRPLKVLLGKTFRDVETRIEEMIATKYCCYYPWPPVIKQIDNILLRTEQRDLMPEGASWPGLDQYPLLDEKIEPWSIEVARGRFIDRLIGLARAT